MQPIKRLEKLSNGSSSHWNLLTSMPPYPRQPQVSRGTHLLIKTVSIGPSHDEILDSPCVPHPWIKPGTQKMKFQPALHNTVCSKIPPPIHWQLEHSKIQKQQNQAFCLCPHWFLTEGSQYQNWKANLCFALPGNYLRPLNLKFDW